MVALWGLALWAESTGVSRFSGISVFLSGLACSVVH